MSAETVIPVSLQSEPPSASVTSATPVEAPGGVAAATEVVATPSSSEDGLGAPGAELAGGPPQASEEALALSAASPAPVADAALATPPGGPEGQATPSRDHAAGVDEERAPSLASSNDTVLEPARPAPVSMPATTSHVPSRDELQALFHEFLRAKKAAGVDDGLDVDFDAFADTIRGESERLIVEHACRGVRFEVAVAEGEVSLRPRLVR